MLEQYKTCDCGRIFCYFMDAFAITYTKGMGTDCFKQLTEKHISLDNDPNGIVHNFLQIIMGFVKEAQPPVIFNLLVEQEYRSVLNSATDIQILELSLSRTLISCLANKDLATFFDTSNMWSNDAIEYAYNVFYPQIPDLAKRYHMI